MSYHLSYQQEEEGHSSEETCIQSQSNIRSKGTLAIAKYALIASSLFVIGDILAEQTTYPIGNIYGMYFAYFTVPFFIFSVILAVYAYSYKYAKIAWKNSRVKLLSILAGIAYAAFYIFTTNIVSNPDLPMPTNLQGFISPYQVYGQMTMWPDVEFWSPQLNLVGYFSVGNVLVVSSLALLTTFSIALLVHNIKGKFGKRGAGSFVGSFAIALSTNACCCCTPIVLPAVFAFFGLASTNPLIEDISFQTSPVFNLLWVGNLGLLLASALLSTWKLDRCVPHTRKIVS